MRPALQLVRVVRAVLSRFGAFTFELTSPAFSALTDFYLALYPAVVLWSLKMNWRKKLALSIALGFGVWYVSLNHLILQALDGADELDSAGAVAVYKCTTVSGLNDKKDFTCELPLYQDKLKQHHLTLQFRRGWRRDYLGNVNLLRLPTMAYPTPSPRTIV